MFLPSSYSKFTGEGVSLAQLESGVPGKTKGLGTKQGEWAGFYVSRRKVQENLEKDWEGKVV